WSVQRPSVGMDGPVNAGAVTLVDADQVPGVGAAKPTGRALRVTLRPYSLSNPGTTAIPDGDIHNSSGYYANRAEVYGRFPVGRMSSTPAAQWPDPVGSERWWSVSILIPEGFQFARNGEWLSLVQWKGLRGGSPPFAIEVKGNRFRLGGSRVNLNSLPGLPAPGDGRIGPAIVPGEWHQLVVGMKLSTAATSGWIEVWIDGVQYVSRTAIATMDTYGGTGDTFADPIYLKQGIYRGPEWASTNEVYFGPTVVGGSMIGVTSPAASG
ncbi:MAG TPA: heparin lyase I family protein, partial [Naasia sp.]